MNARLSLSLLLALAAFPAFGCSSTPGSSDGGAGSTGAAIGTGSSGATGGSLGGSSGGSGGSSAGNGGSSGSTTGTLFFNPASATVVVTGGAPASAQFTLELQDASGAHAVSPEAIQFDRPDLATVTLGNPVVATSPSALGTFGGRGTLHAIFQGREATATLEVQVVDVDYGPGLSPTDPAITALNAANLPDDPAPGIRPLLYPYDGTIWPLGLTAPPVMWNAPQAGDVYRLHFAEQEYSFDGYYRLDALPGRLRPPQAAWDRLTASNQAAHGSDPLTFALLRYDASSNAAYATATERWTVAPSSLRGSIYYWTTSNGGSLSRIPPGAGATPSPIAGPNGNNCMGCHAVSADGSTLVAGVSGQSSSDSSDNRAWTSFDLPSGDVRKVSTLFSGNLAISPDGAYVVSGDEHLKLSDSHTGEVIPDSGLEQVQLEAGMTGLTTPAFSPDGRSLAAIEQGGNDWQYWDLSLNPNSRLVVLDFDPSTLRFSPTPRALADSSLFPTGEQTLNYPSFSPDSKWVAYQVGDHNSGCWTYPSGCQTTTTEVGGIWLQSTEPGSTPVRLSRLSDPPVGLGVDADLSLEPTFNPVERGGYFWVVFTSERGFGNDPDVQGPPDNDKKRLWVSAVDPNVGPDDPSHPAFFLEGQDTTTQNMRGFWTLSACIPSPGTGELGGVDAGAGAACVNGFDCCSGFCNQGQCIGVDQVACAGAGDACTADADCCNAGSVACSGGVCTPVFR